MPRPKPSAAPMNVSIPGKVNPTETPPHLAVNVPMPEPDPNDNDSSIPEQEDQEDTP